MASPRHPLLRGTLVTSLGTLVSRVTGLVRDMATASLFGLAAGGVMDAFVIAFRIPNLFRRLFGEGALTASYLPAFSAALEKDRPHAWKLLTAVTLRLSLILACLVAAGWLVIAAYAWFTRGDARSQLLAGLAAAMLPYLIFICLAALVAATLQALGNFSVPALAPVLLNICWIVGAVVIAPRVTDDAATQAYILAGVVLLGGVLQWVAQWPALFRSGYRWKYEPDSTRGEVRQILLGMIPTALGLAVTQLNTLADSFIAWLLSAPHEGGTIAWLGDLPYPMEQGAAAAIYFGERMYQFPLGMLGAAVATVVFPLLARHAARGDTAAISNDLTLGLRFVLLLALPASAGLMVLAEPIARLLFERGKFTPEDTARTARMIATYGAGVWAYCALPVLVRGYFALGDRVTPVRVAVAVVIANFVLNLILIWPMAEVGMAAATAVCAMLQVAVLAMLFSRRRAALAWRKLGQTAVRALLATAVMSGVGWWVLAAIPGAPGSANAALRLGVPFAACAAVYLALMAVLAREEWGQLRGRE